MTDKNNTYVDNIAQDVSDLLATDQSGHGMEHVNRVLELSVLFAREEGVDDKIVRLAALLHDVDDYKLFEKSHSAQNFFDKLLVIPSILMTEAGRTEGEKRKTIMVLFLRQLFKEEGALDWLECLGQSERVSV